MDSYMILTNNPLAARKLEGRRRVCYISVPYEELLREAEKKICQGYRLLSHPLSGSVKPKETPYKSVQIGHAEREEGGGGPAVRQADRGGHTDL